MSTKKIVFLHGFTQRGAIWDPVVERVKTRLGSSWQIETPDLPGHGETPIADEETFWSTARDLAERFGPAHWVGYSLGGRVLLHLPIEHPNAVQSMVLVGAKAGFEDRNVAADRDAKDRKLASDIEKMDKKALREWLEGTWLTMPMFERLAPAARQVDLRVTNDVHGLGKSLKRHGSGVQEYLVPRLRRIDVPTTVLWAEHDNQLIKGDCQILAEAIPNAMGVEVPHVGHSIPWEAPDVFADFVVGRVTDRVNALEMDQR